MCFNTLKDPPSISYSRRGKNNNREHETFVDIIQELTLKNKISEGDELKASLIEFKNGLSKIFLHKIE